MLSRFWVGCVWLLLLVLIIDMLFIVWCISLFGVLDILCCMMIVFRCIVLSVCSVLYSFLFLLVEEKLMLKFIMLVFRCCVVSLNEVCVWVEGLKNRLSIVWLVSRLILCVLWV